MILLLLLQMSDFSRYLREAQEKLGLAPTRVELATDHLPGFYGYQSTDAAWIPYGLGAPRVVYVQPRFLRESDPYAREIVAYHESCHFYLGVGRSSLFPREIDLQHLMIDGCVEWLLGARHRTVMEGIPCGRWYPFEALRFNRRTGRERCRAID